MSQILPKCVPLAEEKTKELLKWFKGERTGWVQVGEKKWFFPKKYEQECEGFYKFKAKPDDVWLISHPRSGTTWISELIWLVTNDLNYERAKSEYIADRFPFFEYTILLHPEIMQEMNDMNDNGIDREKQLCDQIVEPGYKFMESRASPRFIQTHFPFDLLPGILETDCKIVYVARNPKDMAVSWYNFQKICRNHNFQGTFEQFWNYIQDGQVYCSPYWEHVKEAWNLRHHPNVQFIFYEEMKQSMPGVIKKISKFFGKEYNDTQIMDLVDHLDIKNFRSNEKVNASQFKKIGVLTSNADFIRKGEIGGWREYFNPGLEAQADKWIKKNLEDTDLVFPGFL